MIDVLIPLVDKPQEFIKSIESIAGFSEVNIIVGTTSELAKQYDFDYPNVTMQIFKNGSKREEILNALQKFIMNANVFIARKPFTREEFENFVSADANIVSCERVQGNIATRFFKKLWSKIIRYVFGVKFFMGDTSLMFFNENMGSILDKVNNLSYSTRVSRWRGIKQQTIKTSYPPVKAESDPKSNLMLILFSILSILIAVVVTTLVAIFTKPIVLVIILLVCLCMVCLSVSSFLILTYLFNLMIGKRDFIDAVPAGKGE